MLFVKTPLGRENARFCDVLVVRALQQLVLRWRSSFVSIVPLSLCLCTGPVQLGGRDAALVA